MKIVNLEHLKVIVSYIIEDIESEIVFFIRDKQYQVIESATQLLDCLDMFMNDKLDVEDIAEQLLMYCGERYDILSLTEHNGQKYVVFVINNYWLPFCLGESNKPLKEWAELEKIYEAQQVRILSTITGRDMRREDIKREEKEAIKKLRRFFKDPKSNKFAYSSDVLFVDNVSITLDGIISTKEWVALDPAHFIKADKELAKQARSFYLLNNPNGRMLN